jgi:hypothetical protein
MNKRDKKGKAEIESCNQLKTPEEFWEALTGFFQLKLIFLKE